MTFFIYFIIIFFDFQNKYITFLEQKMNLEIIFQLASLLLIIASGPLVIVLLSTRTGNGL